MAEHVKKPVQRYLLPDWYTHNFAMSSNAEAQQESSHKIRQESNWLQNETDIKTKWNAQDTRERLKDRILLLHYCASDIEMLLKNVATEITALSDAKRYLELDLIRKEKGYQVAMENLTILDARQGIDVVRDDVEKELHNEIDVIEGIRKQLQTKCCEAFEQLCCLQEARQQLEQERNNKLAALNIDKEQLELTETSPEISYKPSHLNEKQGVPRDHWEAITLYNKQRAEAEILASQRLREAIFDVIQQSGNDMETQYEATDFAFRKTVHELERAKEELEWQRDKTLEEVQQQETNIKELEEAIVTKVNSMKLAQTRLENRTYRPSEEFCHDEVQQGLEEEIRQLKNTQDALEEKLKQSKQALNTLQQNLLKINKDLENKTNALQLGYRCLDIRKKLKLTKPKDQTELNKLIIGAMADEVAQQVLC